MRSDPVSKLATISGLINGDGSLGRIIPLNGIRVNRRSVGSYHIDFPAFKAVYGVTGTASGGNCQCILAGGFSSTDPCYVDDWRVINQSGTLVDIGFFVLATGVLK